MPVGRFINRLLGLFGLALVRKKSFERLMSRAQANENGLTSSTQEATGRGERGTSIYCGNNKALTRTVWGHKLYVDTRDANLSPGLVLDGHWEKWLNRPYLESLREGMVVVEVGANIGYYTVLAGSRIGPAGHIYAFEANPDVFELLWRNLEINGLLGRATLTNKAVLDKPGTTSFHILREHAGAGSISPLSGDFFREEVRTIEVQTIALDDFLSGTDRKLDLIKLDAEGSEPLALEGMSGLLENNPQITIFCEFTPHLISGTGVKPQDFLDSLEARGFILRSIDGDGEIRETSAEQLLENDLSELFLRRS